MTDFVRSYDWNNHSSFTFSPLFHLFNLLKVHSRQEKIKPQYVRLLAWKAQSHTQLTFLTLVSLCQLSGLWCWLGSVISLLALVCSPVTWWTVWCCIFSQRFDSNFCSQRSKDTLSIQSSSHDQELLKLTRKQSQNNVSRQILLCYIGLSQIQFIGMSLCRHAT